MKICSRCGGSYKNLGAHIGSNFCRAEETARVLAVKGMIRLDYPFIATEQRAEALEPFGGRLVADRWNPGDATHSGFWTHHLWIPVDRLSDAAAALKWATLAELADEYAEEVER